MVNALRNLLFPPVCLSCSNRFERDGPLCLSCIDSIRRTSGADCLRCGNLLGPHALRKHCSDCRSVPFAFRRGVGAGKYEGGLADWIKRFKYGRREHLGEGLADLLAGRLREEPFLSRLQGIVPVPMTRGRRWERGFNQAEILADGAAHRLSLPRLDALACRAGEAHQASLGRVERLRNAEGRFFPRGDGVKGKVLLVVDDVMTTGATAHACAKALLAAGAREVYVAVVGR